MRVHLVDGTYELFRQHFGSASRHSDSGPCAAVAGVVASTLALVQDGATHIGVASDHTIESFRNDLWAGYKTAEGMDPDILRQIPVMEHIVELSLHVASEREATPLRDAPDAATSAPRPEKPGELAKLLFAAGISEAYDHGYLIALAICPRLVSLDHWLGPLLVGIEFRGRVSVQRVVDLVIMRANRLDLDAGDQRTIGADIASLNDSSFHNWARGFSALVAATKSAWSTSKLSLADRRAIRGLEAAAKGSDVDGVRAILPAWIAACHARRR